MGQLRYEPLDLFDLQDFLKVSSFQKLYRNQDFLNQLMVEGKIRNVDPDPDEDGFLRPRVPPYRPYKWDNQAFYADIKRVDILPANGTKDNGRVYGANNDRFDVQWDYPSNDRGNLFHSNFLPVATVSLAYVSISKSIVVIKSNSCTSLRITCIELDPSTSMSAHAAGQETFSFNIFAIGVAGSYFD